MVSASDIPYEADGSDRVARGSVAISRDIWWSAELAVPMTGDRSALLTLERHGIETTVGTKATLVVPPGEVDALLSLLTGIVVQAKHDGVLDDKPATA